MVNIPRLIRFWKPFNVLTQFTDSEGRATLADYIHLPNIYSAGRLDYDSEGLLLLTDSNFIKTRLTEPKFYHPKTYLAQIERIPQESDLKRLREGIILADGKTRPAQVALMDTPPDLPERSTPIRFRKNVPTAWLKLTITEGRKRQVRRMTAAIGYPTLRLVRWAVGDITLAGLHPGEWQPIEDKEVFTLLKHLSIKGSVSME